MVAYVKMNAPESLHLDRYFVEALYGNHWMVPTEILVAQRTMTLIETLTSGAFGESGTPVVGFFDHVSVAADFFGGSAVAKISVRTLDTATDDTVISLSNSGDGTVYRREITADTRSVAVLPRGRIRRPVRLPLQIGFKTAQFEMPGGSVPGKHLSVSELGWRDPRIVGGFARYLTSYGSVRTNPQASNPVSFSWTSRILPPENGMELTVRHSKVAPNGQVWRFSF